MSRSTMQSRLLLPGALLRATLLWAGLSLTAALMLPAVEAIVITAGAAVYAMARLRPQQRAIAALRARHGEVDGLVADMLSAAPKPNASDVIAPQPAPGDWPTCVRA